MSTRKQIIEKTLARKKNLEGACAELRGAVTDNTAMVEQQKRTLTASLGAVQMIKDLLKDWGVDENAPAVPTEDTPGDADGESVVPESPEVD